MASRPPSPNATYAAKRKREMRAEGAAAHAAGKPMLPNPHHHKPDAADWQRGWVDASVAATPTPKPIETAEGLLQEMLTAGVLPAAWAARAKRLLGGR